MVRLVARVKMQTLAAGSKYLKPNVNGFSMLELLIVIALIAIVTTGVSLSLRDTASSALQRDAQRLAALLETGRALARANGLTVVWRAQTLGSEHDFIFEGLPPPGLPKNWLDESTHVDPGATLTLGPEPLIRPQAVALSNLQAPGQTLWVVTDGLRPFQVQRPKR
jgi:general secretion pathway protein H